MVTGIALPSRKSSKLPLLVPCVVTGWRETNSETYLPLQRSKTAMLHRKGSKAAIEVQRRR